MAAEADSATGSRAGRGRAFTYADALAALSSALTFGINPSLAPITAMAEALGRPHDTFASVQVTGTNGKSSTARLTAALLRAHGMRVGLYTSPELHSYTERIEIDGVPVAEEEFAAAVAAALDVADTLAAGSPPASGPAAATSPVAGSATEAVASEPTEFELLTAAALWLFRERAVDVAVLEVGMGGRWDATSVVSPAVAVITGVGLDHAAHLGPTREAIAADKAHIIRAASAPVLGPGTAGVEAPLLARAEATRTHARAVRVEGEPTPVAEELTTRYRVLTRPSAPDGATVLEVAGAHARYADLAVCAPAYQVPNVATAVATAEALLGRALDPALAREAIAAVRFPGRFEVVARDPWVVVDGAHNPEAAAVLADAVRDAWPDPAARPVVALGVLADKDADGIVAALAPVAAGFVCVAPDSPRALSAAELATVAERVTGTVPQTAESVRAAIAAQRAADAAAGVLVTGSIRTAAEGR